MKVLIVGGAGYIGSVVTRLFLSKGAKVTVLDNLIFGGESLIHLFENPNFRFIFGDVRNKSKIELAIKNADIVINLAALVGEPLCVKYPKQAHEINYEAACRVGDIAKKNKINKYIFMSTCSNYGINKDGKEITEKAQLNPLSLYSETKVNAEKYILNLSSNSFSPVVIRSATVFGLSPRMRFDLLISEFVKEAFLTNKITVYNPEVFRPLIHVSDVANALFLVAETAKKIGGEVFNIGFDNYRKKDIVKKIATFIPAVKISPFQGASDKRDYRVSFKKIQKKLGFKPIRNLDFGIKEIINALKCEIFPNPDDPRYTYITASIK